MYYYRDVNIIIYTLYVLYKTRQKICQSTVVDLFLRR